MRPNRRPGFGASPRPHLWPGLRLFSPQGPACLPPPQTGFSALLGSVGTSPFDSPFQFFFLGLYFAGRARREVAFFLSPARARFPAPRRAWVPPLAGTSQPSLLHLLCRQGKMSESSSKSSQPLASKQEKDGTEKRGRGRPRKQPPVSPGTALVGSQKEPSEVPTPKRPRGRPKGSKNKGAAKTRGTGHWVSTIRNIFDLVDLFSDHLENHHNSREETKGQTQKTEQTQNF
ncbi:hypothetical protein E2I00_010657 [Balaenoptera physalus]|uniref:High mobility group protein HMG-I/HMG-Y n=1 Tax=Balaenoptera physalus TaxID=9770 RepID=A0A643C9S5_BALPH|nr:hypothetical protein E2I00_010657 [Balaenoptera physalus]